MENQLNALISVIVPAYNVENYLERCIKSPVVCSFVWLLPLQSISILKF